ncbi:MAG: GNAT family N-acetyltransferase [Xanthobacteraceae bacterium]|jgi:acetyltransferase
MAAYPKEWERQLTLQDGRIVFVRPIRPDDEPLYGPFFAVETPEDLRRRFFAPVKEFSHKFVARFTHVDYDTAMAFIAIDGTTGQMLGVARLHATGDGDTGEYAILVRSDCKRRGLGWQLMQLIIAYARSKGYRCIEGMVLRENTPMLNMCRKLGFQISPDPRDQTVELVNLAVQSSH